MQLISLQLSLEIYALLENPKMNYKLTYKKLRLYIYLMRRKVRN
jgi:hypothetical protein